METSEGTYANILLPGLCWWCIVPTARQCQPHLHRRPSNSHRSSLSPVGSCSFSLGQSWCSQCFCVCLCRVESLFPPHSVKVLQSNSAGPRSQIPWGFHSLCWIPSLETLIGGLESSQQCKTFFGITVLQFVGHPPSGYEVWFYHDYAAPTISLRLLHCPWTWGIFLVGSSVFLSVVVQQLVAILVFPQEKMSACPCTSPSWTKTSLTFQGWVILPCIYTYYILFIHWMFGPSLLLAVVNNAAMRVNIQIKKRKWSQGSWNVLSSSWILSSHILLTICRRGFQSNPPQWKYLLIFSSLLVLQAILMLSLVVPSSLLWQPFSLWFSVCQVFQI